ncbi:universal stress protein [Candidatus Uhrbacteria bacterium]|nr:universal stress protein [Candidatus Uhrbacteria bacterium]
MFERILVPNLYGSVGDGLVQMARRFGEVNIVCPTRVETVQVNSQTLFVADQLPTRRDIHVLLPGGATQLKRIPAISKDHVDNMVILVPFGSGESCLQAVRLAIQVAEHFRARHLGVQLLFYHTTWRDPSTESEDVWAHIDEEVNEMATNLRRIAVGKELQFRYGVQIAAPTVPDGIISFALLNKVSLIVMARGDEVTTGSYVDQMALYTRIPLLIVRKED